MTDDRHATAWSLDAISTRRPWVEAVCHERCMALPPPGLDEDELEAWCEQVGIILPVAPE